MPEIIAISPGDILVEFDNGPFANAIPLQKLIFEKKIYKSVIDGSGDIHIDGVFDIGSEYLNSMGENPLDGLLTDRISFNVKNIARQNNTFKHHIYDELKNLIIYKVKTIIPEVGSTIIKRYYFATDDSWSKTDIIVPEDTVQDVRVINLSSINYDRTFTSTQTEELKQFIDSYLVRKMCHHNP
jgi:hypothetical protein